MVPPFLCGDRLGDPATFLRRHKERKLRSLTFWRDGLERQLAALNAAIATLEHQIDRDRSQEAN
ncbi:MAG: sigma factor SigF [Cyanobacteriota bacterium]